VTLDYASSPERDPGGTPSPVRGAPRQGVTRVHTVLCPAASLGKFKQADQGRKIIAARAWFGPVVSPPGAYRARHLRKRARCVPQPQGTRG
jgi:hypothetical protein